MSTIARGKRSEMSRFGGKESVRISVIVGVCFSHFFMRFAGGLALVRVSGVSVIARCPQSESRLYYASVNSSCTQPPPPDYCGAFARLVSPWGGAFANFVLPGGRAFANPGSISELLTRTQFPIRIYLHRRFYWKKCRLAHLSRTGINIEEGCKGMLSILCIHFFIAYQARITYRKPELSM